MTHLEAIEAFLAAKSEVEKAAREYRLTEPAWRKLIIAYLAMEHASQCQFLAEYEAATRRADA